MMSEKGKPLPHEKEAFWFQHRAFLEDAGYRLRPKFNPGFAGAPPHPTHHHYNSKLNHLGDHAAQHPVRLPHLQSTIYFSYT
jgi:hypothetical protein